MRESLVKILRCPLDLSSLELEVLAMETDGHVVAGRLKCVKCRSLYPIEQGVPDLLPSESVHVEDHRLGQVQAATVERFGFEWRYFRDWGWFVEYPDIPNAKEKFYGGLVEHTRSAFWNKSLLREKDLQSRHSVLDAGCGNGRFTDQAAKTGAEVIGVDIGWGVYSAFEHTRSLPNVHIVRGDLFRLPFADETFDRIFSIGVLQHTGNARAAFGSMLRTLRPGGLVVAHVYGQGRRSYEILDRLIRNVTTRFPIKLQLAFARITAATARWLRGGPRWRKRFYQNLYSHMTLLPTEHHMYDWWSAPVATHHTQDEVLNWFSEYQLEIVRANPPLDGRAAEQARRHSHGAITVLGLRPTTDKG